MEEQPRKSRGGRPPKPNGPEYPVKISVPCSTEMHQHLLSVCDVRHISIGEAVREALADWLGKQST
jgi:hypothetical protein